MVVYTGFYTVDTNSPIRVPLLYDAYGTEVYSLLFDMAI